MCLLVTKGLWDKERQKHSSLDMGSSRTGIKETASCLMGAEIESRFSERVTSDSLFSIKIHSQGPYCLR